MNVHPDLLAFGSRKRGALMVTYVNGLGGRALDLPSGYLDMAIHAVTHVHPKEVSTPVRELLVSGRFVRSSHRQLSGVTLAELRRTASELHHRDYLRRTQRARERVAAASKS